MNLLGCPLTDEQVIPLAKDYWWSGIEGSYGLPCSDAPQRLREALPNTNMKFNLETPNVNNGWRQLPNYFAMRDYLGMFYLP